MSRARGNMFENKIAAMAEALGYATFIARGSRGPVDIVCFQDQGTFRIFEGEECPILISLVIQVGGVNKGSSRVLGELESAPRPLGSLCIVSKHLKAANGRIYWVHVTRAGKFATLSEAINGECVAPVPKKPRLTWRVINRAVNSLGA